MKVMESRKDFQHPNSLGTNRVICLASGGQKKVQGVLFCGGLREVGGYDGIPEDWGMY